MITFNKCLTLAILATLAVRRMYARDGEVETKGLQSRADAIPAPISIAPSQYWDGNDGPWSSFALQVGGGRSSTQAVRVFISTAAYNIWTIGARGCPDGFLSNCADKRGFLFLPNQSLTWVANSIYGADVESNLGLETSAPVGYDTVALGWQGSGGPSLEHRVVFNIYDQKWWLGLFGVNPQPTNFTNLNDPQPSFMQILYDNNSIPSLSYGYTAGNQYRFDNVLGSLTLGGADTNRYAGGISWSMNADTTRDLIVDVKSITTEAVNGTGTTDLLPGGQFSAYVDSTVASLWLPGRSCGAFVEAFGLTFDSKLGYHLVNGTTHQNLVQRNPNVTITLTNGDQDVAISLPYAAFDLNLTKPIVPASQYYFPLQCAANDTQHTLGRAFLQEAYLIADYNRNNFTIAPCTWDQSKVGTPALTSILSPNLTTLLEQVQQSTSSSRLSGGAVAATVVVSVAVGTLVVGLLFFLCTRSHRAKKRCLLTELDEKGGDAVGDTDHAKMHGDGTAEVSGDELNEMYAFDKVDPEKHGYSEMNGSGGGHGTCCGTHEMDGTWPIYEIPGSEVQELSAREKCVASG